MWNKITKNFIGMAIKILFGYLYWNNMWYIWFIIGKIWNEKDEFWFIIDDYYVILLLMINFIVKNGELKILIMYLSIVFDLLCHWI